MSDGSSKANGRSRWLWGGFFASVALVGSVFRFFASERFDPQVPEHAFEEVTDEANLDFVHNNGAAGEGLLPETMGSGVAVFDFDNDGDQDLLFVNSTYWPWEQRAGLEPGRVALYRNSGDGGFIEVADDLGLAVSFYGMGVAVGDYDNDGWVDVFLSAVGHDRLFRNREGARFEDVTSDAGVGGRENEWSTSAAWVDVNRDGLLDLFVCNYVRWARELGIERAFKLAGIGRGYAGPQVNFTGTVPFLYLNNGDGTFRESARAYGLEFTDSVTGFPEARSLAVAPVDVDRDGWLDFVVANQGLPNYVLRNVDGERFEEVGEAFDGWSADAAGIDAAVLGRGSSLGVTAGSFANEFSQVYLEVGDELLFGEGSAEDALSGAQRFGVFFFDYDLDGRQDLLAVNGYLEKEINRIETGVDFKRQSQLFWNAGTQSGKPFLEASPANAGDALFRPIVGRGAAFGDLDGDGALDVVITQNGGSPLLLRNGGPQENSWLRIKLVGTRSNRDAIGARVEAKVGNRIVRGRVMPTRSYLSQSELPVTLGLGRAWRVRSVEVEWPSGLRERVNVEGVNRTIVIVEGDGQRMAPAGAAVLGQL